MNNRWNEIIYKAWSPICNKVFNSGKFLDSPKDKELSFIKKLIRPIIKVLGTDIGLRFVSLIENNQSVSVYSNNDEWYVQKNRD